MIVASRGALLDTDIRATLRDVTDPPRVVSGADVSLETVWHGGLWQGVMSGIGTNFVVVVPVKRFEPESGARVVISVESDDVATRTNAPWTLGSVEIKGVGSYRVPCSLPIGELLRGDANGLWIGLRAAITGSALIQYGGYVVPPQFGG